MTFEEFIGDRVNVLSPQEYHAVEDVWNYQQNHIEKLEWDLGDVENALNNMKQYNQHLRNTIADLTEKLDIERNGTEYVTSDVKCKSHPDAPHGYNRNLSHAEGRYVCECEHWEPDECLFDTQEEHDRYSLEQSIMLCWGITDDLHLLADAMESGEHKRMHHEMLLNLSQLYELKFQKLFKEFEKFTGCC